jgi:hypothetical protein
MLKPRHPLVVVDWNFFQSVAPADFKPPRDWDFLLPDEVIHEVLDKADTNKITPAQHFRKLISVCVSMCGTHKHRIWLARPADSFTFCSRRISIRQITGPPATPLDLSRMDGKLRDMLIDGRVSSAHSHYEQRLSEFRTFISEYRQWFQRAQPDDGTIVNDKQKCEELARDASLLRNALRPEDKARLSLTDAQLAAFPDALPCCRWLRLLCWYSLRHAPRPTGAKSDLIAANDFADASYAFLSSYTGHLLTNDGGCQEAAHVLRPSVRIWTWDTKRKQIIEKTAPRNDNSRWNRKR